MDLKQLEEEIDYLKKRIANLEHKKLNEKFEVKVPEGIEDYYYVDELGEVHSIGEKINYYEFEKVYQRGLVFKTREEAEQFDKERILLFKLHNWAKEHNGDWYPDWGNCDDKFYITYHYVLNCFQVCFNMRSKFFSKLPYFKTEEIAKKFIEEFGDEIKEVLC